MEYDSIICESQEVDVELLRELQGYIERKYPDAIFKGQIINGKRNGKGVMRYKNGR